ncbi:hypothetical protein BH23ACT6_BH23ACT6_13120 [soil metagenome]
MVLLGDLPPKHVAYLRFMAQNRSQSKAATFWSLCLVSSLAVAGCSDSDDGVRPSDDASATSGTPYDSGSTSTVGQSDSGGTTIVLADTLQAPQGPTGDAFGWIMDTLNTRGAPDPAEVEERFAPSFLEQVPAEDLVPIFEQIRGLAPMRVTSIQSSPGTLSASVDGGQGLVIDLALDDDGLISGLTFSPDPLANRPGPEGYEQVEEELSALSQQRNILAARVEDGQCVPVYEHESQRSAPAGSAFKLYVLGALIDAVERGDLAWDQELSVTDEIKSLPSGTLQEAPAGTKVSVERSAELMISISDNTATDMLIEALGVDAVEDVYADMGLSDPDGLTPVLTTAQLFQLGWGVDDDIREQWSGADTQAQRQIVADLPAGVDGIDPLSVTEPRWGDGIDYFVSAADLCAAHVALQERAATPAGGAGARDPCRECGSAQRGARLRLSRLQGRVGARPVDPDLVWRSGRRPGRRYRPSCLRRADR